MDRDAEPLRHRRERLGPRIAGAVSLDRTRQHSRVDDPPAPPSGAPAEHAREERGLDLRSPRDDEPTVERPVQNPRHILDRMAISQIGGPEPVDLDGLRTRIDAG